MGPETTWDKWRKNGRLSTVALILVAMFWYYYTQTTPKVDRDPIVNQALWLMLGSWVTNIAYGVYKAQQAVDAKNEERTSNAERKADAAETKADQALKATHDGGENVQ
jgi:hypothetical protein